MQQNTSTSSENAQPLEVHERYVYSPLRARSLFRQLIREHMAPEDIRGLNWRCTDNPMIVTCRTPVDPEVETTIDFIRGSYDAGKGPYAIGILIELWFRDPKAAEAMYQDMHTLQCDAQDQVLVSPLEDVAALPEEEIEWPVPDLLPPGLCMLAGAPKTGKSTLASHIAINLAAGRPVLEQFPAEPKHVLYIPMDEPCDYLIARYRASGLSLENRLTVPTELTENRQLARMDTGFVSWLTRYVASRGPDLIVIDSYKNIHPSRTSMRDAYYAESEVMEPLTILARRAACTILLLHHTRKRNVMDAESSAMDRILGTTALAAAMDATFVLSRESETAEGKRRLILQADYRRKAAATYRLRMDAHGGLHPDYAREEELSREQAMEKLRPREGSLRQQLFDVLRTRRTPLKATTLSEYVQAPQSMVVTALNRMAKDRRILKTGTRDTARYSLPEE